jgi:hypothetical protein
MKILHLSIIAMAIFAFSIISYMVFFTPPFTVKTDQDTYLSGKTITVFGNVGQVHDNIHSILIQTFSPDGYLYKSYHASLIDSSNVYSYSIPTENWGVTGKYTIKVIYANQTATISINFIHPNQLGLRELYP